MEYMSVKEAAEKWNISPRRVQTLCKQSRIDNVFRLGSVWAMPKGARKPIDKRTTAAKNERLNQGGVNGCG